MPWLCRARRFVLAALFLSLSPLTSAVAGEVDQIRTDVADALAYAFVGTGNEAILSYAGIDVAGSAAPYDVTVRRVQFAPQSEKQGVFVGDVGFKLSPAGAGLYTVSDLRLPSAIADVFADGMDLKLYVGGARLDGVWSQPLRAFLSLDAAFDDVAMQGGGGGEWVSAAALALQSSRSEVSPGRWDQRGRLSIRDMRFEGEYQTFGIGRIDGCLRLPRVDMQALRTLWRMLTRDPEPVSAAPAAAGSGSTAATTAVADCAGPGAQSTPPSGVGPSGPSATPPGTDAAAPVPFPLPDVLAGFSGAPAILGDVSASLAIQDFYIYEDGAIWRYDRGGLDLDLAGADGVAATLGLNLHVENLRSIPTPEYMIHAGDLQHQRLLAGLVPRDIAIRLRFDNLPFTALWSAFVDSQKPSPEYRSEDEVLGDLASAAYDLVRQAGSGLRLLGWRIASRIGEVRVDGAARGSAASPMGAAGTLDVSVTGLDEAIRLLRDTVAEPADVLPLNLLVAVGARQTDPAGTIVDRYAFSLDDDGKLLLNGKDFLPIIEMMQQ